MLRFLTRLDRDPLTGLLVMLHACECSACGWHSGWFVPREPVEHGADTHAKWCTESEAA